MSATETFDLELNGTAVRGSLHVPPKPRNEADHVKPGVVIVCLGPSPASEEVRALGDDLTQALTGQGLAVATFDGDRSDAWLIDSADRASAALHALAARDDLDLRRFGVLGHSLGGIPAASLA